VTKYCTQGIELGLHLISSTVHGLVFFKADSRDLVSAQLLSLYACFYHFLFVSKYLESCVTFTVHISIWCSVINTFLVVLNVVQNVLCTGAYCNVSIT